MLPNIAIWMSLPVFQRTYIFITYTHLLSQAHYTDLGLNVILKPIFFTLPCPIPVKFTDSTDLHKHISGPNIRQSPQSHKSVSRLWSNKFRDSLMLLYMGSKCWLGQLQYSAKLQDNDENILWNTRWTLHLTELE